VLSVDRRSTWVGYIGGGIISFRISIPHFMPTLTELRVRAAKPAEKPYKLFVQRGLFMLVTPAGGRLWRFKYKRGGVEKLITLGQYPEVSLKRAREKRDDARRLSRQAVGILRELMIVTARQRYVFPAIGGGGRPISETL